jgi:nucleotide-binding universal stress UspA family protein
MTAGTASRSPGPVATRTGSIVVGHDGSAGSVSALTTALELADRLLAPVVIVRTWSLRTVPRPPSWEDGYRPSSAEMSEAVHDRLVKDVRASIACFPDVEVTCHAVHAGAVRGLVDASRGVRMLVVGSSGQSPLRGSALGSVIDQCVRDAACPVLVVRPRL